MHKTQRELLSATRKRYEVTKRDLAPLVVQEERKYPGMMAPEYALSVNTTINVVKEALAVAMDESMPQPRDYFVEIATRLACYVLTALPLEDQEVAAMGVRSFIMEKLAHMQSQGFGLTAEWEQ